MRRRDEVAETLRQRVISAHHFGTLRADRRLPSARSLAGELDADPRVVLAAYRMLEREGLVHRRPPSRAYYASGTAAGARIAAPAGASMDWLVDTLAEGIARDIALPAFPEHARRAVETLRLRAACLECNADQIVWLTREVADDYGLVTLGVETDGLTPDGHLPSAVRSADLLVTTPSHAALVHGIAARLRRPWVAVTPRPDLTAELARALAEGPVYFVATDPRFAAKLGALYAGIDHPEHVRPVILGVDDPGAIPAGAPAYVMRSARDALGGVPPHVRALSTLRAFSPESRRALVRFVVHANAAANAAAAASREPA